LYVCTGADRLRLLFQSNVPAKNCEYQYQNLKILNSYLRLGDI
jgi:hypothetical protein